MKGIDDRRANSRLGDITMFRLIGVMWGFLREDSIGRRTMWLIDGLTTVLCDGTYDVLSSSLCFRKLIPPPMTCEIYKFSQHLKLKILWINFADDLTSRATCEALPALSATNVYQMTDNSQLTLSLLLLSRLRVVCGLWFMFSISVYRYVSATEQSTAAFW